MVRAVIRDDQLDAETDKLAKVLNKPREEIRMVLKAMLEERKNNKRQPKPPPPERGICLRAAERKYGIGNRTLSAWAKLGYLPIIKRTKNELYIDEVRLVQIIDAYKSLPSGQRQTIKKAIAAL